MKKLRVSAFFYQSDKATTEGCLSDKVKTNYSIYDLEHGKRA